jgi:hypothetical protein
MIVWRDVITLTEGVPGISVALSLSVSPKKKGAGFLIAIPPPETDPMTNVFG